MSKPISQAVEWCEANDDDFIAQLDHHLANGWVYSGDDAFVMATEEYSEDLLTSEENKDVDTDTWYVYLYAGSLKRVLELIPYNNKFVAFRRNNGAIKMYETKKLLARIERV